VSVKVVADLTFIGNEDKELMNIEISYLFGLLDGIKIKTRVTLSEGLPPLPRFGYAVVMPEGAENVRYFGYGPTEAYEDKKLDARLGFFRTTATDNFVNYIKPQENGAHYGCRFADVSFHHGQGLYFSADKFSLSVSHYSPKLLTGTAHAYELKPEKETTVIVDYRNAGIGSESCGPKLLPEYTISEREIDFTFNIKSVFAPDVSPFDEFVGDN
jgi:beta-galactosidase